MKRVSLIFVMILLLTGSCSLFDSWKKDKKTTEVTPEMARDTLYYIMKAVYYWYNLMPAVDKDNYSNPYDLLEAMKYKELDRWSFVADYDEFLDEMEGTFVGHGIMVTLGEDNTARIGQIYKNAPLYSQGVRRGWIIKTINGYDLANILITRNSTLYNTAFGPSTAGITNNFVFIKPDGTEVSISSTKQSFTINTVILYDTINLDAAGTKVAGHLVLESFILPTEQELKTAFSYFKSNNVQDLIVDLRYNTGGYLNIAQQLASYIGGNSLAGTTFAMLKYNAKYQSENVTYSFLSSTYSLNPSKIVFITTRSTASASEALINGLLPHKTIVSVGDTTTGKPVGMNGWPCAEKYFFWPITFKIVNSQGTGDYFDGLIPSHLATDDVTRDFSDKQEECLKEAILYLKTGAFSGKGRESFRYVRQYSEKPSWMNNMFVIK
jgi:carboxyl-terminal processing protease